MYKCNYLYICIHQKFVEKWHCTSGHRSSPTSGCSSCQVQFLVQTMVCWRSSFVFGFDQDGTGIVYQQKTAELELITWSKCYAQYWVYKITKWLNFTWPKCLVLGDEIAVVEWQKLCNTTTSHQWTRCGFAAGKAMRAECTVPFTINLMSNNIHVFS